MKRKYIKIFIGLPLIFMLSFMIIGSFKDHLSIKETYETISGNLGELNDIKVNFYLNKGNYVSETTTLSKDGISSGKRLISFEDMIKIKSGDLSDKDYYRRYDYKEGEYEDNDIKISASSKTNRNEYGNNKVKMLVDFKDKNTKKIKSFSSELPGSNHSEILGLNKKDNDLYVVYNNVNSNGESTEINIGKIDIEKESIDIVKTIENEKKIDGRDNIIIGDEIYFLGATPKGEIVKINLNDYEMVEEPLDMPDVVKDEESISWNIERCVNDKNNFYYILKQNKDNTDENDHRECMNCYLVKYDIKNKKSEIVYRLSDIQEEDISVHDITIKDGKAYLIINKIQYDPPLNNSTYLNNIVVINLENNKILFEGSVDTKGLVESKIITN